MERHQHLHLLHQRHKSPAKSTATRAMADLHVMASVATQVAARHDPKAVETAQIVANAAHAVAVVAAVPATTVRAIAQRPRAWHRAWMATARPQ